MPEDTGPEPPQPPACPAEQQPPGQAPAPDAREEARGTAEAAGGEGEPAWPDHYKPIRRIKCTSIDDLIKVLRPQAEDGVPLIIEGTNIMNIDQWSDLGYLHGLLKEKNVLVKKSPTHSFRYFDLKKNIGKFDFKPPLEEEQMTMGKYLARSESILKEGGAERMYLQETLSGHSEMAEEFASWRWELLIRVSSACGWGLPDSNELFVGMRGAQTPLHFDERENLFFQVRGAKQVVVYPFVDYLRMYPFPTTHPCDRQSMVGNPMNADHEAFPRFRDASGHYATLQGGDLLYLPYGWWHWLRNKDHHSVSVSFWSTTPPTDFSKGVPTTFTEHMITRVRRNLESMIAQQHGPEKHNESMLRIRESLTEHRGDDEYVAQVRNLLAAVKIPPEKQDAFLLEIIEGRFGIDWGKYV